MTNFNLLHRDADSGARAGILTTRRGRVQTPCFMPVGTQGAVKGLEPDELRRADVSILLSNAYHLYLRPGLEVIEKIGGLHRFMGWEGPILTDSGGFQVFSLADLVEVKEEGVVFQSHIDGSRHSLTPEGVVEIQRTLDSDIWMPLDQCVRHPAGMDQAADALERTRLWAQRSRKAFVEGSRSQSSSRPQMFGIIQGSTYPELRRRSALQMVEMDWDGYAVGGLSVGESADLTWESLEAAESVLPEEKPRYLMGVGSPSDLWEAVARGIDMFDCVLPTRNGRNGCAFSRQGNLHLRNAAFAEDPRPIDEACACQACRTFSRAYLRHLFNAHEMLGPKLVSLHNLVFYQQVVSEIRCSIEQGRFNQAREAFLSGQTVTTEGGFHS